MSQIKVIPCPIEGLYVIEPLIHNDERGYFFESFNAKDLEEFGLRREFVQDNESYSVKGVLRGLHFQKEHPQCKICRAIDGEVFDVAVDLRGDSPTYGQWYGAYLSSDNHRQIYIPEGFAHGLQVLSPYVRFAYKCTDFWHPEDEGGVAWNDPDLGIEWPTLSGEYRGTASGEGYTVDGIPLMLSNRDQLWPVLKSSGIRF